MRKLTAEERRVRAAESSARWKAANPTYQQAYREAHRDTAKEYGRAYYREHRTEQMERNRARKALLRATPEGAERLKQYDRNNYQKAKAKSGTKKAHDIGVNKRDLLAAQGGKCGLCGKGLTLDGRNRDTGSNIDHDHKHCQRCASGRRPVACPEAVRGLLCHTCNVRVVASVEFVLGLQETDPDYLAEVVRWINRCRSPE